MFVGEKLDFCGFGGKIRFHDFGEMRFYGFGGKMSFTVLVEKIILIFWQENTIL